MRLPSSIRRSIDSCSTPFGITEVGIVQLDVRGRVRKECSTPFGITEVGIPGSCGVSDGIPVLNAFRHHRGGHSRASTGCGSGVSCSTPFGITEVGIRGTRQGIHRATACSTPFGITEVGIVAAGLHREGDRVCSTPFGITEVGILERGHHVGVGGVLNAFRHHRGWHSARESARAAP